MIKLAFAVLLFGIVCSAFNPNNVYNFDEDNDYREFDQTENFNQPENDNDDFQDFGAEFEDDEFGEIEAIQGHVKYQDAARDVLLKLAAELRKGKNVTNAFLKVIDKFEKGIAEFHAALRRRTVKPGTISNIKDFIKEAAKNRTSNTKIIRELTSQGLFMAQREEKSGVRAKRSDFLILGAAEFLNSIKEEIGEDAFDDSLSISGLVTLMFAIDDTGSMGGEIKSAFAISEQIVKAKRDYDVDYILSPFNDPGKLFGTANFHFFKIFVQRSCGFSGGWVGARVRGWTGGRVGGWMGVDGSS